MDVKLLAPRVAECVGLWLAEGDSKSRREITFTNNCWNLINLFYKTINKIFNDYTYNPRIYVYSKEGGKVDIPIKSCAVKFYKHQRATKPYFILRFASVKMVKRWKKIIETNLKCQSNNRYVLRGFFAGEGNLHSGSHNTRIIRISQKEQKRFIDKILDEFNIRFSFDPKKRNYIIYGKPNWDIFARLKIADLHPDKKEKFWKLYNSFKEEHYSTNYLIKEVYTILGKPRIARELSKIFNRSFARIQDVLILLKKQGKIFNFRVGSISYWTNNEKLLIISKLKNNYLLFLDTPKQTSEFAKYFKVCWKSSFRRLKELEKLNLTRRRNDGKWIRMQTEKNLLVI